MKKDYKKKYEFQKKITLRQEEQIKSLKLQIEELRIECKQKDDMVNSINPLREELTKNINELKKSRDEYDKLLKELKDMKNTLIQTVYSKGLKWKLIKLLIK